MVNLLGMDITEGAENGKPAGAAFIVRQADAEKAAKLYEYQEKYTETEQKAGLPPLLSLLKSALWLGWVIPGCAIMKAGGFADGYRRVPWLYWLCAGCFAAWLVLFLWEKRRQKQVAESPELKELNENADRFLAEAKAALHIPENAVDLDVFGERFILKNGEPKHKSLDGFSDYLNLDLFAFAEDGSLFLASAEAVWEIPLTALRSAERTKKLSFAGWNKQKPYNHKDYRKYKVTVNQFGMYFARCWRVNILDSKGEFYLLIPEYDADAFSALTGLHLDNDKMKG